MTEDNENLTPDEFIMYAKIATIAAILSIIIVCGSVVIFIALLNG